MTSGIVDTRSTSEQHTPGTAGSADTDTKPRWPRSRREAPKLSPHCSHMLGFVNVEVPGERVSAESVCNAIGDVARGLECLHSYLESQQEWQACGMASLLLERLEHEHEILKALIHVKVTVDAADGEGEPPMLEDRDLASVDILGEPGSSFERFAGRTLLAEFLFHALPEKEQKSPLGKAADEAENDTLAAVADSPGFSLRDVEVRLAYAHRLLLWCDQPNNGPYGAAATRMVATALSDVVLMRAAERARPRLPETAEATTEAAKPLPTVTMALEQMTDLLRDVTELFKEQREELRRLHGERKEEPAAA